MSHHHLYAVAAAVAATLLASAAPAGADTVTTHPSDPGVVAVAGFAGPVMAAARTEPTGDDDPAADRPAATWGVMPSTPDGPDGRSAFEYKLDPGATLSDWVSVSNHSTGELTLQVYAHDAYTTAEGGFDLHAADVEPTGVGSWVTLAERTITVDPRTRVDLPFRIEVPTDATPGDHAGGLVASLQLTADDPEGEQVSVEHRVGARIYLRVTGELAPQLEVEQLDASYTGTANPFGTGSLTATYTVRNTGNVRLAGEAVTAAAGPFGLGRRSSDGAELPEVLPGDSYTTTVALERVAPLGRLRNDVTVTPVAVDDQTRAVAMSPARGQTHTWALPYASAGLVLLLAAAVAGVRWHRRHQAARLAAAVAAAREAGAREATARSGATGDEGDGTGTGGDHGEKPEAGDRDVPAAAGKETS